MKQLKKERDNPEGFGRVFLNNVSNIQHYFFKVVSYKSFVIQLNLDIYEAAIGRYQI